MMNFTQPQRTVLALIFTAAFLITGKLFVWKSADDTTQQMQTPQDSLAELQPDETSVTVTNVTTTTVTTTTVTTTIPDHFETVLPEATVSAAEQTFESESLSELTEPTTETEAVQTEPAAETESVPDETDTGSTNAAPAGYFSDALFIGDSRTVGQACYGPIEGATYFATVGLSTYKIDEALSEVPGTEGMDFNSVLYMKQYSKIYIMLGINELGNDFSYTMQNFRDLIARIQAAQPGAIFYLEANLHVSASRHNTDAVVNNTVINNFNAQLAALADNQTIFYLDVNPVFDDAYGCLNESFTSDGTHPYAKHYAEWANFIMQHVIIR